jgi:hypothetical protein
MLLCIGGLPDKGSKMSVGRQGAERTRHDQIASLFRLGNETTSLLPADLTKCSAKASGSGWLPRSGLSRSTNSNGRPAEAAVIGGVSQRNAGKGASANNAMKNSRKTGWSFRQRSRTSENGTGWFFESTLMTCSRAHRAVRIDHIGSKLQTPISPVVLMCLSSGLSS